MTKSLREHAFDGVEAGNYDIAVWQDANGDIVDWQIADPGVMLEDNGMTEELTTTVRRDEVAFAGMFTAETIQQLRGEQ